jgi:hypothetical protein
VVSGVINLQFCLPKWTGPDNSGGDMIILCGSILALSELYCLR